jgi:ribosomal protein S18 acetylase RimI-like enzyme
VYSPPTTPVGDHVTLRQATPVDRDLLYRVYASSRADELAVVPWSDQQTAAFLRMQFDAQDTDYHLNYADAEFLVVVVDGEDAGRMYVHRRADPINLIDIALLPEHRGQGVGTALVTELLAEARSAGRRVTLHVEPFNPALRLYQRLGFRVMEEQGVYWLMEWRPDGPRGGVTA